MPTPITAAMLYDLVQCQHRPTMDLFGDPRQRRSLSGDPHRERADQGRNAAAHDA